MQTEEILRKPLPSATNIDREFWEAVQKGSFKLQSCLDCRKLQFFPRPVCVHCFGSNLGWQECRGKGKVYSFTAVSVPLDRAFGQLVKSSGQPVIFALVDLDEGPRVYGEITGCSSEDVQIGEPVQLVFETVAGSDFMLPKFQLGK